MVYVVMVRYNAYAPISRFNYPQIDSIYDNYEAAAQRAEILQEGEDDKGVPYVETEIFEMDVLPTTSYYNNPYDERYYEDLKETYN